VNERHGGARLARRRGQSAHNSAQHAARQRADVRHVEPQGHVGVGTDGANCSIIKNMYEAMRSFVRLRPGTDVQLAHHRGEGSGRAQKAAPARSTCTTCIIRIAPGWPRTMIVFPHAPHQLIPTNDPVNALVYTEVGTFPHDRAHDHAGPQAPLGRPSAALGRRSAACGGS
jgi:cytosine/adenosine deaminase-related metal-dependent hydrolase